MSESGKPVGAWRGSRYSQLDLLQESPEVEQVDMDRIRPAPAQAREVVDDASLEELAESMERHGLLQAVLVRPAKGRELELIAGERRWRAARMLGWATIPARVLHHVDDTTAAILGLVENVDREGLTAWEEAQGVAALRNRLLAAGRPAGGTEMARLCGWSEAKVSERLTIAEALPANEIEAAELDLHDVKKLSKSFLLNISRLPNIGERMAALYQAIATGSSEIQPAPGGARPPARRPGPGRPRSAFTFRAPKSGRISLQLRRPVSELSDEDARTLLRRLEPVVEQLRQRSERD
jgi:ParB/RepB/Spo0J family partition protein